MLASKRPRIDGIANRINTVGIELEGGWDKIPKGVNLLRDGSVTWPNIALPARVSFDQGSCRWMNRDSGSYVTLDAVDYPNYPLAGIGEIPLGPFDATSDALEKAVLKYYPNHVNETCGMHVHMAFKNILHYQILLDPKLTKDMVKGLLDFAEEEKLAKDHPMWPRLIKTNHPHCAHVYCGDEQVKQTRKDFHSRGTAHSRYTAINYRWGFQGRTVEIRLLPMFETPEQALRASKAVFKIANRFLSTNRKKEPRRLAQIATDVAIRTHYQEEV